jgi:ketosteroid isomerase-like protein
MSTNQTATRLDLEALRRGIEDRDAAALLTLFAPDAELRLIDNDNPPSTPRVLNGQDSIRAYLEDVAARDMTHQVQHLLRDGDTVSYLEFCQYADGTRVLCAAAVELRDELIIRKTGVQAWDH